MSTFLGTLPRSIKRSFDVTCIIGYGKEQLYGKVVWAVHIRKVQARKKINRVSWAIFFLQKVVDTALRILLDKINHALALLSVHNENVI